MGEKPGLEVQVPDENGCTIVIKYSYDAESNAGTIHNWGTDVMVDHWTLKNHDPKPFSALSHPNLLRVLLVDDKNGNIVYEKFEKKLAEWQNGQTGFADRAVITYSVPRVSRNYATISNPKRRKLAKGLMKFIVDLHSRGYATTGFTRDNIVILNGKIKVWGIGLVAATEDLVKTDYSRLSPIMEGLFRDTFVARQGQLPYDVLHFLKILTDPKTKYPDYSPLLIHHVALKSSKKRLQVVIRLKDRASLAKRSDFRTAFEKSMRQAGETWRGEDIMQSYEVGGPLERSPIGAILQHEMKQEESKIIYNYNFDQEDSFKRAEEFVRFLRNLAIHLVDKYSRWSVHEFDLEADAILYGKFGNLVCDLQNKMFHNSMPYKPKLFEYFFGSSLA